MIKILEALFDLNVSLYNTEGARQITKDLGRPMPRLRLSFMAEHANTTDPDYRSFLEDRIRRVPVVDIEN